MPLYQVTCQEMFYIDRTYEIEAETAAAAVFDDTGNEAEE